MKKLLFLSFTLVLLTFTGCTPKDPAILKVFVRSSTNQLVYGAKVIIIGDQQSNPATLPYVDTTYTNSSGFTTFDMDEYFNGKKFTLLGSFMIALLLFRPDFQ